MQGYVYVFARDGSDYVNTLFLFRQSDAQAFWGQTAHSTFNQGLRHRLLSYQGRLSLSKVYAQW